MSSSSESSPSPSPSPPASPEASFHHGPVGLERLIEHFVVSKRSLAATASVYRANEIVTSSRDLVEEIAVLGAKNSFAKRGVDAQVDTLHAIKDGVAETSDKAGQQFDAVIASLDAANDRLQRTLKELRNSIVDTDLQRAGAGLDKTDAAASAGSEEDPAAGSRTEQKTLYDFVNEEQHEELLGELRGLIDSFNDARGELDDKLSTFAESVRSIEDLLHEAFQKDSFRDKQTIYDQEPAPSIPSSFKSTEEHAVATAQLLQSLLGHYDLCVNALKHTEGGGEAAKAAVQDVEGLTKSGGQGGVEESLFLHKAPEGIGEHERLEMLAVVEHDSAEVEDVVAEIRDRTAEMEGHYERLCRHASAARSSHRTLRSALAMLHAIKETLPSYLTAAAAFRESWSDIQVAMTAKTEAVVGLAAFYTDFQASYGKLLREVERRKATDVQMRKLALKAQKELDSLHKLDAQAREDFMETVGEYLPRDLWPSLADEGTRWEVRKAEFLEDGED